MVISDPPSHVPTASDATEKISTTEPRKQLQIKMRSLQISVEEEAEVGCEGAAWGALDISDNSEPLSASVRVCESFFFGFTLYACGFRDGMETISRGNVIASYEFRYWSLFVRGVS